MEGYEATRQLRQLGYQGIIVGVTANALPADVREFVAQGVDGVVTKPVDVPKLLDIIEKHMSLPPSAAPPAAVSAIVVAHTHSSSSPQRRNTTVSERDGTVDVLVDTGTPQ
jgi:DNA-binding NarL/FixJ family response regulator